MRTVLYADPAVSSLVKDKFVAHWSSERPVPKVTIDFGDGRVIKRTVTGNSAHYVMTGDGTVVDVLPGVYPAGVFTRELNETLGVAKLVVTDSPSDNRHSVQAHHSLRMRDYQPDAREFIQRGTDSLPWSDRLVEQSRRSADFAVYYTNLSTLSPASLRLMYRDMPKDLATSEPTAEFVTPDRILAMGPSKAGGGQSALWGANAKVPNLDATALKASSLTLGKLATEAPIIKADVALPEAFSARVAGGFSMNKNRMEAPILAARPMLSARSRAQSSLRQPSEARPALQDASALASLKTMVDWPGAGTLHGQIARKQRGLSVTKQQMNDVGANIVDPFLLNRARSVESNLAGDAAVNELVLRPIIREWLAQGDAVTFEELNTRVFAEIFLTPRSDPWLGMLTEDMWTGIKDDGVVKSGN